MTAGGLVAILMTLALEMTGSRRSRVEVDLGGSALPEIRRFLASFAARNGWGEDMAARLDAVGEEALLTLLPEDEDGKEPERGRSLHLAAYREEGGAVLEFVVAPRGENLQDRIAILGELDDEAGSGFEREVSLRLLRHLSSSVRHQQYHDTDIVTVSVKHPAPGARQ